MAPHFMLLWMPTNVASSLTRSHGMSPNALSIPLTLILLSLGVRALADDLDVARRVLKEAETNLRACGEKPASTAGLWASLGRAKASCGEQRDAIETLSLAWKMALSIPDDSERHDVLRTVARGQIQCSQLERLLLEVNRLPYVEDQSYALKWIVDALGKRRDLAGAVRVAGLIRTEDVDARADALRFAGFSALKNNDFKTALKVCELFPVQATATDGNSSDRGATDAQHNGQDESIRSRNLVLSYLARGLARAGKFDEALQAMRRITKSDSREAVFRDIAKAAGDAGRLDVATSLLHKAPPADQKEHVLAAIAKARVKLGRIEEAYQTVDQVRFPALRCQALLEMAAVFAEQGAEEHFWRAYNAALAIERKEKLGLFHEGDKECVRAFLKANCLGPATSIAENIKDPDLASHVWQAIGMAAAKINNREDAKLAFEQSHLAANRFDVPEFQLARLNELAAAQAQCGDRAGASVVFKSVLEELHKRLADIHPDIEEALWVVTTEAVLGDRRGALEVLPSIADALDRCSDPSDHHRYLREAGETFARIGEYNTGIRLAQGQRVPIDRVHVFLGLVDGLVANSKKEPLIRFADPIRGELE